MCYLWGLIFYYKYKWSTLFVECFDIWSTSNCIFFKDAKSDAYLSFTLHWKAVSLWNTVSRARKTFVMQVCGILMNNLLALPDLNFHWFLWAVKLFYLNHALSCIVMHCFVLQSKCVKDVWSFYLLYSLSFFSQHSLGDILSSDFYNDNDFIPALFTVLHATDVNIASGLRTEKEGPYIALLEVTYYTDVSILYH